MQQTGILPNAVSYNALISACKEGKQPEPAQEVLETMREHAILPNVVTYSALISACEKS